MTGFEYLVCGKSRFTEIGHSRSWLLGWSERSIRFLTVSVCNIVLVYQDRTDFISLANRKPVQSLGRVNLIR